MRGHLDSIPVAAGHGAAFAATSGLGANFEALGQTSNPEANAAASIGPNPQICLGLLC